MSDSTENLVLPWQEGVFEQLASSDPHSSLLIKGPKGIGKSRLALALARKHIAQGDLESERIFDSGNHPDFQVLVPPPNTAKSERDLEKESEKEKEMASRLLPYLRQGSDVYAEEKSAVGDSKKGERVILLPQVRELLRKFCPYTPKIAKQRIVVFYPACQMQRPAVSALLKLLEEPPDTVALILVAHQADRMPPTILSRCQKVDATVPTDDESRAWLKSVGKKCPPSLFDLYKHAPTEFARLENPGVLDDLVSFLRKDDRPQVGDIAAKLGKSRASDWMALMTKWVGDLVAAKFGTGPIHFKSLRDDLGRIARKAEHMEWLNLQAEFVQLLAVSASSINVQLLAERTLGDYTALAHRK